MNIWSVHLFTCLFINLFIYFFIASSIDLLTYVACNERSAPE